MKLIAGRHGEAEAAPNDFERHLTEKGRKDIEGLAQIVLNTHWSFKEIRCSPVLRAVQTAQILADNLGGLNLVRDERLAPGFEIEDIFELLNSYKPSDSCIWIYHAPDIQRLVSRLVGVPDSALYFPPGTMAAMNLPLPALEGRSMLVWKMQPELISG